MRELAAEAEVNPTTMQKALSEPERQGLLTAKRTAEQYIIEDEELIAGLREQLAWEIVENFFIYMEKLGYTREDVSQMLERSGKNADDV